MKKIGIVLLLALLVVLCLSSVAAADTVASGVCGENLTWTLDDFGVLSINGTGDMFDYTSSNRAPWYYIDNNDGIFVFKIKVGNGVTSIGDYAFSCCSSVNTVTLPSSVKSIGVSAFDNCNSLDSITIPDSVISIGEIAFESCANLTSVTIGKGVTTIGDAAFRGCWRITGFIIPSGVTSISDGAFYGCSGLTSISIPSNVTYIGSRAFEGCNSLTSVTIPAKVSSIGDSAFCGCSSLTEVVIPKGVPSIGFMAFADCTGLHSVTIPASVTSIGWGAFMNCSKLASIFYGGTLGQWKGISIDSYNECLTNAIVNCNSSIAHVVFKGGIYSRENAFPEMDIPFSLDMFAQKADHHTNHLAIAALVLAANAYDRDLLADTLAEMGFSSFSSDNYGTYDDINRVAYGIASTKGIINGQETNVIAISCRGSAGTFFFSQDWQSNIWLQDQGFRFAAEDLKKDLDEYIVKKGIDTSLPTKLFITGHSRGAAVANDLGTMVSDITTNDNVFVYTFACPNTTDDSNRSSYSNIINYIVESDPVPLVPVMNGGSNKYGHYKILNISNTNYFGISFSLLTGVDKSQLDAGLFTDACVSDYIIGTRYHAPATYMACLLGYEGADYYEMQTKFRITVVKCPVDVAVYHKDGTLLGTIVNNEPSDDLFEHGIFVEIDGEEKYIFTTYYADYDLVLTGTGEGTMEFISRVIDSATGETLEEKDFSEVTLQDGKTMTSSIGESIDTNDINLYVVDEDGAVISEVQEDGTEVPLNEGYIILLDDYASGAATITGIENGDRYSGNTAFTVSCADACGVLCSSDGENYTRLTGTEGDNGYSFNIDVTQDMTVIVALKGDVNLDGVLKNQDVTMAKAANLGKRTLSTLQEMVADVTGDGIFKNQDITKFKAALLGKTTLSWDL